MHIYDPNGSIKAYRRERERREDMRSALFCVGLVCSIVFLYCGVVVAWSLWGPK